MPINTTDGPVERIAHPDSAQRHINTSAVVEEDLVYEDAEPEIDQVVPATGWAAEFDNGDLVPLVVWVCEDSGEMYGVVVEDGVGRVDLSNNVAEQEGFRRYVIIES